MDVERLEQVAYLTEYEDDVESDLSAFHRIDDPMSIDGPRYFRLAVRLPAYMGVMQARAAEEQEKDNGGAAPAPTSSTLRNTSEKPTRVSESVLIAQLSDGWVEHTTTEGN